MTWTKSSYCDHGNCVWVDIQPDSGLVHVTRTGNDGIGAGHVLTFTADEWRAFTAGAKAGEFDL